nr:FimD/PapC C-terminal domain-containing protein [Lelliottia sp. WB101]
MQDETDDDKIITGIVSDQGQVYLSGLPEEGNLMVKWGDDSNQKCKANYALRSDKKSADSAELIKQITAQCH